MRRNKFNLSHYRPFTCDMGYLIPLTWFEALPGDYIQMATSMLVRLTPVLAPLMHPVRVRIHNFFVPYRLIWEDFEDFITGGPDGSDTSIPPYFTPGDWSGEESNISDYLGIPPVNFTASGINVSALPFRAYNMIYNEYYRDQDLVSEAAISTASGADGTTSQSLLSVCWEKDYFTTARTSESRGDQIIIPMTEDELPVMGIGMSTGGSFSTQSFKGAFGTGEDTSSISAHAGNVYFKEDPDHVGYPDPRVDFSSIGIDVNDFRLAMALQRYQEMSNKYGARYEDYLRMLGVRPLDSRLQKPEYLSGGQSTIQFSEVLTHSTGDGSGIVGDMAGHGISGGR